MEFKIKNKQREKRARIAKEWGILKYLSAEISFENSEIIQDHRTRVSDVLGQKLGYDTNVYQTLNSRDSEEIQPLKVVTARFSLFSF